MASLYSTLRWQAVRAAALKRDGNSCTVGWLLGGQCSEGSLHVHHIIPVEDGGDPYELENLGTTCAAHHPQWEALRRLVVSKLLARDEEVDHGRCPHKHASAEARAICERRRSRAA